MCWSNGCGMRLEQEARSKEQGARRQVTIHARADSAHAAEHQDGNEGKLHATEGAEEVWLPEILRA